LNIGTELYGKNDLFERPILVIKVFNNETIKVLPLTSGQKLGKYYFPIDFKNGTSYAAFTHAKTISTKRLSRKVGRVDSVQFNKVVQAYKDSL
jgi:mRNA-degrading endonuclease toxin of MazEF toxin-antitoxin module